VRELELVLTEDACTLRLDGRELALLHGGTATLLVGAGERLRELDIEAAIERSEEWLMPCSRLLQGLELVVHDATGRVRGMLGASASFTLAEVEQAFTRAYDAVAHGRAVSRGGVADVVLLRELAHHGRLSLIVLA
jgi:hypothetical protein